MPIPPDTFRDALILTGPTGSGKTALALGLAERLGGEVVAMDSMTLYRGLDVGTAKPTPEERRRVPHHLIDVLEPWESASVAWWLERAAQAVADIQARGRRALIVGGTPLYLKAVLFGLFDGPPADPAVRRRLEVEDSIALHARLADVDPATARRLHPNDRKRIVRALEVHELTGRPISAWQHQWRDAASSPLGTRPVALCLDLPRSVLYARIDARVEAMLAGGWAEEVRRLRPHGRPLAGTWEGEAPAEPGRPEGSAGASPSLRQRAHPLSREADQALGYREVRDFLDGKVGLAETTARIQRRSRQYAKRQLTWFRHLPGVRPVAPDLTTLLGAATMGESADTGAPVRDDCVCPPGRGAGISPSGTAAHPEGVP